MRNLATIVANYDSASTGFSDGKLRDNPGDDTGSGVMSAWGNDIWYALRAIVKKYSGTGDVSDTPESENNHDVLSAIEQMMGLDVYGVDSYNPATTYSILGESVMYAGIQFVNINTSANLGKTPLTEPLYWLPLPDSRDLFVKSVHGLPQWGASHPIHDFNNAAYKLSFGLGTHRIGGYNGTTFTAVGIHLDGRAIGPSGSIASDIVEAWHLKNVWFPGSKGSRRSIDARGRLLRAIDAAGGQAELMAGVLNDQMQGHVHWVKTWKPSTTTQSGGKITATANFAAGTATAASDYNVTQPGLLSNPFNGTPRTGSTTRDKSVTGGVPYMVVMVPAS